MYCKSRSWLVERNEYRIRVADAFGSSVEQQQSEKKQSVCHHDELVWRLCGSDRFLFQRLAKKKIEINLTMKLVCEGGGSFASFVVCVLHGDWSWKFLKKNQFVNLTKCKVETTAFLLNTKRLSTTLLYERCYINIRL